MEDRYYGTPRTEILPWLPERVSRMLTRLRRRRDHDAVRALRDVVGRRASSTWRRASRAVGRARPRPGLRGRRREGAPRRGSIAPPSLDLVLCLDVLEHMAGPWAMVRRFRCSIAPAGRLIVSVAEHPPIEISSGGSRRDGRLRLSRRRPPDRTHLRFFVRRTAIELATCGGLRLGRERLGVRAGASRSRAGGSRGQVSAGSTR